jgi:serine/threonine protein kinase
MNERASLGQLNTVQFQQLDELAHQFTQACDAAGAEAGAVDFNPFLPPAGNSARPAVLHELVKTHLEICWRRGLRTTLADYVVKFPELGSMHELPGKLIYEEYRIRQLYGDKPGLAAYKVLFPSQYEELQRLEIDQPVHTVSSAGMTKTGDLHPNQSPKPPSPSPVNPVTSAGTSVTVGAGYKFLRRLGRGSFGEVWHAEAPGGIDVAVKIINQPLDHEEAQRELQALDRIKRLRHPYLLQTQAAWSSDDRLYIAMELASCTLRDRLKQCRAMNLPGIPEQELFRYITHAAEALDFLHEQQVIHRDIKPENILILQGYAKVADFGLVRRMQSQHLASATSSGTPAYMAPEVWRGKVSVHSDQYSLAASYAEMRMDQRLYQADTMVDLMLKHLEGDPDLGPLPLAEQAVLRRALSKDPDKRYDSCQEFARQLGQALTPGSAAVIQVPVSKPRGDATSETPTNKTVRPGEGTWADVDKVREAVPPRTPALVESAAQTQTPTTLSTPKVVAAAWRPQAAAEPRRRRIRIRIKILLPVVLLAVIGAAAAGVWYLGQRDPVGKLVQQGEYKAALDKTADLPANEAKTWRPKIAAAWLDHVKELTNAGKPREAYEALRDRNEAFAAAPADAGDTRDTAVDLVSAMIDNCVKDGHYREALELVASEGRPWPAATRDGVRARIRTAWEAHLTKQSTNGPAAEAMETAEQLLRSFPDDDLAKATVSRLRVAGLKQRVNRLIENDVERAWLLLQQKRGELPPDQVTALRDAIRRKWKAQIGGAVNAKDWPEARRRLKPYLNVPEFKDDFEALAWQKTVTTHFAAASAERDVDTGDDELRRGDAAGDKVAWQAAKLAYVQALATPGPDAPKDLKEQALLGQARACARLGEWPQLHTILGNAELQEPSTAARQGYTRALTILDEVQRKLEPAKLLDRLIALKKEGLLPPDGWEDHEVEGVGRQVIARLLDPTRTARLPDEQALREADVVLQYQPKEFGALLLKARAHYHQHELQASRAELTTAAGVCKPADLPQVQLLRGLVFISDPKSSPSELDDANGWLQKLIPEAPSARRAELCQAYAAYAHKDAGRRRDVLRTLKTVLTEADAEERRRVEPLYQSVGREYRGDQLKNALARISDNQLADSLRLLSEAADYSFDDAAKAEVLAAKGYVRAIGRYGEAPDKNAGAVADELVMVLSANTRPIALPKSERKRAAEILVKAADELVEHPTDGSPLSAPFRAGPADKAAGWLGTATQLFTEAGEQPTLRTQIHLALAAASGAKPDPDWVRQLVGQVSADEAALRKLGTEACPFLVLKARQAAAREVTRPVALRSYAAVVELLRDQVEGGGAELAVPLCGQVLDPAIQLGEKMLAGEGDAKVKEQVAGFAAMRGQVIRRNEAADWPFGTQQVWHEVEVSYTKALKYDDRAANRARHYARRGMARAMLVSMMKQGPERTMLWAKMRSDKDKALDLDSNLGSAHALSGFIAYFDAFSSTDKTGQLEMAAAEFKNAIDLTPAKDDTESDRPQFLTARSQILYALAHRVPEKRKDLLHESAQNAQEATELRHDRSAETLDTLGNALEDLAWLGGVTREYSRAADAFRKVTQLPRPSVRAWINLGRCQYKRVAYGNAPDTNLTEAEQVLRKILDPAFAKKRTPVEEAEGQLWLGETYLLEGKLDKADTCLKRVTDDLAGDPGVAKWEDLGRCLRERGRLALLDAQNHKRANKSPAKALKLARKMAKALQDQKTLPPWADGVWLLGQIEQCEGTSEPKDVLKGYDDALEAYRKLNVADEHVLRVSLGRLELILKAGRDALADRPSPDKLIRQAEAAIDISKSPLVLDPWLRAEARQVAYRARLAAAGEPGNKHAQEYKHRQQALADLQEAVRIVCRLHPDYVRWRLDAAELLLGLIEDEDTPSAQRAVYQKQAGQLLDEAKRPALPGEDRDRMQQLRLGLKKAARDRQ